MDALSIAAASGMRSRLESLEMLANNLANASTGGYKTDREFYSLYVSAESSGTAEPETAQGPGTLPVIEKHWTDFSQGNLRETGSPVDMALSGGGFFGVNGPGGQELYTRDGSFRLSSSGVLTTSDGYPVRAVGGTEIQLPTLSVPINVLPDGTVQQSGQTLGQLEVTSFKDNSLLEKSGRNYFEHKGQPQNAQASSAEVQQGKVEGSNVGTADSAVRLVSVMRQFEMLQKAMNLSVEMNKSAIQEVAKTGA